LAAIEKAGVEVKGKNQALASVIGASYCLGADTASMLGLMICEFVDEGAAQKGRQMITALFGQAMPTELLLKRKTTLSVTNLVKSDRANAEAKKIANVFRQLP